MFYYLLKLLNLQPPPPASFTELTSHNASHSFTRVSLNAFLPLTEENYSKILHWIIPPLILCILSPNPGLVSNLWHWTTDCSSRPNLNFLQALVWVLPSRWFIVTWRGEGSLWHFLSTELPQGFGTLVPTLLHLPWSVYPLAQCFSPLLDWCYPALALQLSKHGWRPPSTQSQDWTCGFVMPASPYANHNITVLTININKISLKSGHRDRWTSWTSERSGPKYCKWICPVQATGTAHFDYCNSRLAGLLNENLVPRWGRKS